MEQTWYLFPGQTLENTKIKDRGKALKASPTAWNKILAHLDEKRVQQEIAEKEQAHRQSIKDGSDRMVKSWDNSIEKVRQHRMEEHEQKIRDREEGLYKRYIELTQAQVEERRIIAEKARKTMYMKQEKSEHLNSALLLTEVLYERKLQEDFNARTREQERIEEEKYAQKVKFNAEEEKREKNEAREKRNKINKKYGEDLTAQINKNRENATKEKEDRINSELEDNKKGYEEMKEIQNYEFQLDQTKKANVRKQLIDNREEVRNTKQKAKEQDECENQIVAIYAQSKAKLDCMKKVKLAEALKESQRIREAMSDKLKAYASNIEAEEEKRINKAVEELEERHVERIRHDEEYQKRLRKEREVYRQAVLAQKQKEESDQKERAKWEMANRLKVNEVIQKWNLDKAQRLFDDKINYRKELNEQCAEDPRAEQERIYRESEVQYIKEKNKKDDEDFFAYSQEVLDLAKSRGRSLNLILKVVEKYKRTNNLVPIKKSTASNNKKK